MRKLEAARTQGEELRLLIHLSVVQVVTEALEESVDEARILKEEEGQKRTAWRLEG